MASLFSSLLDRDNPAKKLQKEIEGMEFKKHTLIAAVQSEVQIAQQKFDGELYQIGAIVYGCYVDSAEVGDKLMAHFDDIASQKSFIAEKEAKIREIASRYDEEIGMLNVQLGLLKSQASAIKSFSPPANATVQGGNAEASCENCGKPYSVGEDMFCIGCGNKLA